MAQKLNVNLLKQNFNFYVLQLVMRCKTAVILHSFLYTPAGQAKCANILPENSLLFL